MTTYFEHYLKKNHFLKRLSHLKKKIGEEKIIIYGAGKFFEYINNHYDLSNLNIIGISDVKFSEEQEGSDFLNYPIIPRGEITEYNPDWVLVSTENYIELIENLCKTTLKNTDIHVEPLVKKDFFSVIKYILTEKK